MLKYIVKRLLLVIPTFIGVTLVVFVVTRFVPGGPIDQAIQQAYGMDNEMGNSQSSMKANYELDEDALKILEKQYGFDKPFLIAYVLWFWDFIRLDFGTSFRYGDPVITMITSRFGVSIYFGLTSLIVAYLISIPLGVSKALKHNSNYDNITSGLIFVGYALPGYVVGILLLGLFSFNLGILPLGGIQDPNFEYFTLGQKIIDRFKHLLLPLVAYSLGQFATMTLVMKNNLMENMASDYIKTAIAKGKTFKEAMWLHAFRNSIIPIAARLGSNITIIFAGSFLIENIFNIRGIGQLSYEALVSRDFPVVLATLGITSLLSLVGNVISDIIVSFVDPRIKLGV